MVLAIAIPVMIQNGITQFVNLLDNIMVGRIGTEQMSGAAIVNQLIFIYNLCILGGLAGPGIFTAQYYGHKNLEGVRQTARFKLWLGIILTAGTVLLFIFAGEPLISLYLQGEGSTESIAATLLYGKQYLMIMILGLPAYMIVQVYASTLRECGETLLPMKAGIAAILTNLVLNYILIYGKFGAPALGVEGAAIATVISRYVEAAIVLGQTHRHTEVFPFIKGLYASLKVPVSLTKKIILKGTPLLVNETLWGIGMASLSQSYSVRGLNVIAATNISSTVQNIFNIVFLALGSSIAIIVGQLLGAGKMDEAKDTNTKLTVFSILSSACVAVILFLLSPLFPEFYNTSAEVKELAIRFMRIFAVYMPVFAFLHATYFTLRSGGKTIITFLFDSGFLCLVNVPIAYFLSRHTALPVILIYMCVLMSDLIKVIFGGLLVKKGVWLQNLVDNELNHL